MRDSLAYPSCPSQLAPHSGYNLPYPRRGYCGNTVHDGWLERGTSSVCRIYEAMSDFMLSHLRESMMCRPAGARCDTGTERRSGHPGSELADSDWRHTGNLTGDHAMWAWLHSPQCTDFRGTVLLGSPAGRTPVGDCEARQVRAVLVPHRLWEFVQQIVTATSILKYMARR